MDPEDSGTRDGDNPDRDAAPPPTQDDAGDDGARSAEAMVLRYDFAGEGTVVFDLVGMADGAVRGGATLDGRGGVQLDGYDDFVDLPNGTISGLTETTIMVWLRWDGGTCWQRVFDFGSSTNAEGEVLIDKMLATSDNSEDSVAELTGYKEAIAAGEFWARDRRYVRARYARLTK